MKGKEKGLVYMRMGWFLLLTVEICIGNSDGGQYYGLADLTKWGLYCTYFTMLLGLFACKPIKNIGDKSAYTASKNKLFQSWKWFSILFELSLLIEIVITVMFWTIL